MNARGSFLAGLLLLALAPAVARAQDDPDTKAARARFQEGVEAFDKGNYEAARAAFKQAYALKHHPAVLLNLAQSSLKSGHYLEASQLFQQYLNDPQGDKKDDARKGLADTRSKLGRLEVSAPPGSEITIDTNTVGKAPFGEPVDVEAGNHTVHAHLPDGTTSEQKIMVTAGQVLPVRFSPAATVVTSTNPPPTNVETPPTQNPPSNPPPTENHEQQPPLQNPPPSGGEKVHPTGGLVLMVAGGALVVGGAILAGAFAALKGSANTNYTTVENNITMHAQQDGLNSSGLCNNPPANYAAACSTLQSNRDAVNQDATVANVGVGILIGGAVLAIGGAVWYFVGARSKESASASFSPWIAPGLTGGAFQIAF